MLAGLRKLVESLLRHIVDDRILLFCLSRDRLDRSILAAIQHKQCYGYYDDDDKGLKEYDKASKYLDAEDAKAQLQKAADKAAKAAAAKPEDEKLAKAAEVAAQAAKDAADGTKIPETFKDYLQKYVYGCKDQDDLLNVLGGARLMNLKNEPHLGYSTRH